MDFSLSLNFQPRQIVCLEHQHTHLYAEVIQVIESRQMCWVRPLLLFEPLQDLRLSSDLVLPLALFRPAFDTEVIPLLVELSILEPPTEQNVVNQKQLNQFIRQLWDERRNEFQA